MKEAPAQTSPDEVFVFPLSFAQQRLWFLHQMDPASAAYNMPLGLRLSGPLDVDALRWSLDEIVRRHEILRTTFDVLDQQPAQLVTASGNLSLAVAGVSSFPESEREAEAERLASEEAQRPFDLVHGPLIRALLITLDDNEHLLLLTMHHIVSDGWSQTVLMNELTVLYETRVEAQLSPLPELSIQYADFAEWQREWLRGELLDQQLEYWRRYLAGAPPSLDLPTDRPRPAVQTFNGARESFVLSRDLSASLIELSRREGATLFMSLLAAFSVLLHHYTAATDVVIGTPVANRNRSELEPLIGFFVNTLALRIDLSGDPAFRELLARVREVSLGAYAHQDLPFEMLVEKLRPVRDVSRNPLFQVMFALQNTPETAARPVELVIRPAEIKTTRAIFDLTLDVTEAAGQLEAALVYNTDLFDQSTIESMAEHFKILLTGVASDPVRRISALPLLTTAELRQLLVQWNDTRKELTGELCIHRRFEEQVERTPEAIAVVFEERRLTYAQLNQQANKLAHYLMSIGVGPETFVGLMPHRSPEMIVALLAILKAGSAYVPLDPASPRARLAYVMDDARISVVVTERTFDEADKSSIHNPENRTDGDNAAYVIYTSGSTGTPKGVVIAHRGVCNSIAAMVQVFPVRPESCVLQFASLTFDGSVQEILTALTTGARLCLVSRETLLSGRWLAEYARQQKVTVATLPPSMLAVLSPDEWPALETVVSAGERCPAEIAVRWSRGKRFINGYGPTEATIGAAVYEYDDGHEGDPPVGRPFPNTQIYLLDQHLNPVPVGAAGELHIGGVGVARGYLGRPDLTAEKFIPDPFGAEPGARLYKTGDMGRFLRDGNITFLGRRDEQLKLHGLRIEPGEIEATLKQHASVANAAVVTDGERLIAYVKPRTSVSGEELRMFASQRLPGYMTPSLFVVLDELPVTASGKVDRAALRARQGTQLERVGERVGPRDLLESKLAGIWEDLLHVQPDVRDNFFELGGHSLLLVPLLARVEDVTGKRLDVAAVFRAPTIESLATLLRQETLPDSTPLVAIQPHGSLTPVFFLHPAGGSVAVYFALAQALGTERPVYALQRTDEAAEVESLAAKYVDAIRAVQTDGPYILGGWSTGGVVAFEIARQLQACGADVAVVALLDSLPPGHYGDVNDDARVPSSVFLADIYAIKNYNPPAASLPLLLLRAADEDNGPETTARWNRLSSDNLTVQNVPGDHFTMMRAPHVSTVAERLRAYFGQFEKTT